MLEKLPVPVLRKVFLDHPASVNETYLEHLGSASSFGTRMIIAGLACLIHGLIPCWFERTGSTQIVRLHERMVVNRARKAPVMAGHSAEGGRS